MKGIFKQDAVYAELKKKIWEGKYKQGDIFPPEVVFARELGIARNTLRAALSRLEDDGLVTRIKSVGTVVCRRPQIRGKYLLILNNLDDLADPYLYIMPQIQAAAEAVDIGLEIINRNFLESITEENGIRSIVNSKAEGVIFLGNNLTGQEKICSMLKKSGLPVLLPHASTKDHVRVPEFAVLRTDMRRSLHDALKFLANSGYHRVAFLMKANSQLAKDEQLRGFSRSEYFRDLRRFGFSTNPALLVFCQLNPVEIQKEIETLLLMESPPDVILGYSDFYSMYVLQILNSLGISVPAEIGVMGLCGYPGGGYLFPPLTTIDYQYGRIGRKAIEFMPELIALKQRGAPMPEIIMPHSLMIRSTTKTTTERLEE